MIFLTKTKCKIRFIYVGVNCLMEKTILNFHFDYMYPPPLISLLITNYC